MVSYKLVSSLEDTRNQPVRRAYTWPMKLTDVLLALVCIAIMGTAVYMGSGVKQPPQKGCDHVSHLAGKCRE